MILQYSLSVDDLIAFNQFVIKRSLPRFNLLYTIPFIILILALALNFWMADKAAGIGVLIFINLIIVSGVVGSFFSVFYPRQIAIIFSIFIACLILLGIYSDALPGVLTLVPVLIFGGFTGLANRKMSRYYYEGKNDMLGSRILKINKNGVHEETDSSESSYHWDVVSEITSDKKYIYIFLGRLKAYIVPRSYFGSTEAVDSFIEQLQNLKRIWSQPPIIGQARKKNGG